MDRPTYDRAEEIQIRLEELEKCKYFDEGQEVDITIVLNNYNQRIKLNPAEVEMVKDMLEQEKEALETEFENL